MLLLNVGTVEWNNKLVGPKVSSMMELVNPTNATVVMLWQIAP